MNCAVNTLKRDSILSRSETSIQEFEVLMGRTRKRAYVMALQLTRNRTEAEDLVQETYLKAWKGFDSYIAGRPFLNWLLRIMQRAYLDIKRRENPIRKAESLNFMISPSDGEVQEIPIPDNSPSPDDQALYTEFTDELRSALNELPDVYRQAILMCDIEGLSYSEIAKEQHTTIGTVRSRIHRGRKLLRDITKKRGLRPPTDYSQE